MSGTKKLFGRREEIGVLKNSYKNFSIFYISGFKGVGKTTLICDFLKSFNDNSFLYIKADHSMNVKSLIKSILNQINLKSDSINDLFNFLKSKQINIVIDDLEKLDEKAYELIKSFSGKEFSGKIFFLSKNRLNIDPLSRMEIFNLELNGLSKQESYNFIDYLFKISSYKKNSDSDLSCIYNFSAGNPLLIKSITGDFLNSIHEIEEYISKEDIIEYLRENILGEMSEFLSKNINVIKKLAFLNISCNVNCMSKAIPGLNKKLIDKLYNLNLLKTTGGKNYKLEPVIKNLIKDDISLKDKKEIISNIFEIFKYNISSIGLLERLVYLLESVKDYKRCIDLMVMYTEKNFERYIDDKFIDILKKVESWKLSYREDDIIKLRILADLEYTTSYNNLHYLTQKLKDKDERNYYKAIINHKLKNYAIAELIFDDLYKKGYKTSECLIGLIQCNIYNSQFFEAKILIDNAFRDLESMNFESIKDKEYFMAQLNQAYGCYYYFNYKHEKCFFYYKQAENIYVKYGFFNDLYSLYLKTYKNLKKQGWVNRSYLYYFKANNILKKNGLDNRAYRLNKLSEFYISKRDYSRGEKYNKQCIKHITENNDLLGTIYKNKGLIEYFQNNFEKAKEFFDIAIYNYKVRNQMHKMHQTEFLIAICEFLLGKSKSAEAHGTNVYNYSVIYKNIGMEIQSSILLFKCGKPEYEKIYLKQLEKIGTYEKNLILKRIKHFESKLVSPEIKKVALYYTNDNESSLTQTEYEDFEKRYNKYPIYIDYLKSRAYRNGKEIKFFGKNIYEDIIKTLVLNKNDYISRDDLYQKVWKKNGKTDLNIIRVNMNGIKRIFGDIVEYSRKTKSYNLKNDVKYCVIMENS